MLGFLENHATGAIMAEETKDDRVTLEQLMVSTLAMTDAAIKTVNQKGHIHRRGVQRPIGD